MYYNKISGVHASALIHGISAEDALAAAQNCLMILDLDHSNSGRELRLGFDTRGRLLEIVVVTFSDDRRLIIHSMKARKLYRSLIPKGRQR
jgi:hypothetical protein